MPYQYKREPLTHGSNRLASLKRQLRFHHERRKMVESDPDLTPYERVERLECHDLLRMRLLGQLIELEGHRVVLRNRMPAIAPIAESTLLIN